ncbi:phage terminase small subunit P27 family [Clostridium perfringens]|uniref:phage terminase small subunit P27 family n=1 Tax=Clostridium perfringens TaxID=1502 RepID=UPI00293FB91C|nr:phage terminase small subunit P27 family [Clostridium perfringens]MDM0822427.1 phage terminase small subunit P27 family [Clostridium perfringens]MDM0881869.1 phage terminase small subunit P27 family [Clostridium perfringens]MDV5090416.1 phage terminase small subunit P27 family [Clostridium perfringens]MDV5108466.1 phage terminase small subunit P27 family [Clostridium perfringens]
MLRGEQWRKEEITIRNPKPIGQLEGHITKKEKEKREAVEKILQGTTVLTDEPPEHLNSLARKYYRLIIRNFPDGILNKLDGFAVTICADALSKMQEAKAIIEKDGMIVETTNKAGFTNLKEHPCVGIYNKYSSIFNTFGSKLGLSPADRSKLALINVTEEEDNLILKALRGEEI